VGPSEMFNRLMCEDYGVDLARTRVLRHPVDGRRFTALERTPIDDRAITLLFASRLSTRKGLELIVALSHRLSDLDGRVRIAILGGGSLWSDYTGHLKELNPAVAKHLGEVTSSEMPKVYAQTDIVLVPSHYEPGSLVVGEALAAGLPIVASDQVGPVEVIDSRVCRVFPRGDLDAFEREVRALVQELRAGAQEELATIARSEAQERFSPERMGAELIGILNEALGREGAHASASGERAAAIS
jgi:glycosyltransferase involved in cell wall biosynthesis